MIYTTIEEWIEHNPNHIGAIPIEVCHQIWGTKGKETSMIEDDDDIQEYKKPWVGLTDEEFEKLIANAGFTRSDLLMIGSCVEQIVKLVEAKLKEKNA